MTPYPTECKCAEAENSPVFTQTRPWIDSSRWNAVSQRFDWIEIMDSSNCKWKRGINWTAIIIRLMTVIQFNRSCFKRPIQRSWPTRAISWSLTVRVLPMSKLHALNDFYEHYWMMAHVIQVCRPILISGGHHTLISDKRRSFYGQKLDGLCSILATSDYLENIKMKNRCIGYEKQKQKHILIVYLICA